ncbi:MAG: Fic family protein [Myxococcaceae bacterium]
MASPSERLAESLERLRALQRAGQASAIRARDLSRTHRERLVANGFLRLVIKGWYIPGRPDEARGESTAWFASFWAFAADYLESRFRKNWSLSPEQSLSLHAENWNVPSQLVVRSPNAGNEVRTLLHGISLLDVRATLPAVEDRSLKEALRMFSLEAALVASSPSYFKQHATDVCAALAMVRDGSGLLARLLDGGNTTVAGRLAGALRHLGRDATADEIVETMGRAGYPVREINPFVDLPSMVLSARQVSPHVNRLRVLWRKMRGALPKKFPPAPGLPKNAAAFQRTLDTAYAADAYHSLSIEGYQVSADLIERVRAGRWNPAQHQADHEQRNAMAARGYFQAFQAVKTSIGKVLRGQNPGEVAEEDHRLWYRELFAPSVTAGLVRPAELAGYRNGQVYIRGSQHVPLRLEAMRDAMPAFFELLAEETDAASRAVLGHFFFVFIHPYMDGNGRMGRFLMNVMLAAGGYPWTIVPVQARARYMSALENASVGEDIRPFATLLASLVSARLAGEPLAGVPGHG